MTSSFLPAARFHFLTPLYEAAVKPFMWKTWNKIAEEVSKRTPNGGYVVDLGCGPGSVLRIIRSKRPDIQLTGVDIDPGIIGIARKKVADKDIEFYIASIDATPIQSEKADVVISTLMFHHLSTATKAAAFEEAQRILKPGGIFLLCDFSSPRKKGWGQGISWWRYLEPEIEPQLQGQLSKLGEQANATSETIFTSYGCISLHAFIFKGN